MKRINFSADLVGDIAKPGIQSIINRLQTQGDLTPEELVDNCLDLLGPLEVQADNRQQLVNHAQETGILTWANPQEAAHRVGEMLQLIVSLREYQYA